MPPKGRKRGNARGKARIEEASDNEEELPPPPPPRPFKEIEGLPMSIDEPSYSILSNALSLKDSAVLYSSLMRSRKSYTNGNIFDLYWAKGKTKFDNDVNARDRMNKFCDCSLSLGPHNFDVRFFILKDEEVEKRRQDEKEKKKEKRLASKKMREEKQRIRDLKNKAKQDALNGQPQTQINGELLTNPVAGSQPPLSNEASSSSQVQAIPSVGDTTENDISKIEDDNEDEQQEDSDSDENESDSNDERGGEASAQPTSDENTQPPSEVDASATAQPVQINKRDASKPEPIQNELSVPGQQQSMDTPPNRPLPPLQVQKQNDIEQSTKPEESQPQPESQAPVQPTNDGPAPQQVQQPQQAPQVQQPSQQPIQQPQQQPIQSTRPSQPPPQVQPPQPSQSDIMQTPESQMMIANLNLIARMEPALNSLMKIVATGNAKPEQIREFQGYIQRAKAMGPTPYYRQTFPNAPMNQPYRSSDAAPVSKNIKPPKPPKKVKPPKEKQLTTFQEMYVDGADLVFEFSENSNIRYHLPKDSVIEKLENDDILVSTLVIHNRDQIKRWKKKQEAKKLRELKGKEETPEGGEEKKEVEKTEETSVKEEEEEEEEEVKLEIKNLRKEEKAHGRVRKTRKMLEKEAEEKEAEATRLEQEQRKEKAEREAKVKIEKERKAKEQKEKEEREAREAMEDQEPVPYFSAISFTLTNISKRYLPILHNSFNKYEDVKERMEKMLKEGIRVPKYFLWYSVDAYEDENLAEALREALYLIENPPKGKNKKRVLEENPLLGFSTNKKIKKEA